MTTETDNTPLLKITPNFVPFKSAEGFQHTKNILNQIRRDVIDKIRKNEGPEQNPSLCPVLFYIALPSTGFLHNLSEITYDDLLLAPVLNGIFHKLYYRLCNDYKKIYTQAIEEIRNDYKKIYTQAIEEIRNDIWGNWLTFEEPSHSSSSPKEEAPKEEAKLQHYFDDLTKDFDQINNLSNKLDKIRKLPYISHATIELINFAEKLVKARHERRNAYNKLVDQLSDINKNNQDILKKIKDGIMSHPKYSHVTSDDEKLKNWKSLMGEIEIIEKGATPNVEILNTIIQVFLDLPQEMNSSLGFSKLHIRAYEEFASRNDVSSIALDDLVYHPVRYKPLDVPDDFPLYNILNLFEKMFYGTDQQLSAIIFMPIRPFPNSGLIMGQAITINVGPPNLKAHIDALKLYEGRISQAIKLDFYNSIINNIMSKKYDINKVISVVGNNLRKILPASAFIVVGDGIKYAASVDVRTTPGSYQYWEYDSDDETKKNEKNLDKALIPLCVTGDLDEDLEVILKKNEGNLSESKQQIRKLADISNIKDMFSYKYMEDKLSETIVWSILDAGELKSHFKFNRAVDFKRGVKQIHSDEVQKYRLSALLITMGNNSFESKTKGLKSWSKKGGLITFLLFFEEPVFQEQAHMKSILEEEPVLQEQAHMKSILGSAASEIVITIASSISIAAAASEQLAKAANAMAIKGIVKQNISKKKAVQMKKTIAKIEQAVDSEPYLQKINNLKNIVDIIITILNDRNNIDYSEIKKSNYEEIEHEIRKYIDDMDLKSQFVTDFKKLSTAFKAINNAIGQR